MRHHTYVVVLATFLSVALVACTQSKGNRKDSLGETNSKSSVPASSAAAGSGSGPGINLNCAVDHIQNPSDSFHYSFKKTSSNPVHQEADITPQSIDGFRVDINGQQHPLHAVRSDVQGWQGAWTGLTGISGMSSTVAIINHNSAMRREADGGPVNGYDTIHYSIDTARFDATESQMLLDPGDSEKGDAWVTSDGCPVMLRLDSELHKKDGTLIEKIHYEVAMVKK